ncbi:MAG: ATP-grasp domain-containing protein [Taibaiella sp.]|nr:ATP-grasp domain-containing protein [Taibaiella sp.]
MNVPILHNKPALEKQNKTMFENLKIGIIGGGVLENKLLVRAVACGLNVCLMDKEKEAKWARNKYFFKNGDPMNFQDVLKFGEDMDILKVDDELVNLEGLRLLQQKGVKIYPSPEVIQIIQDKNEQKLFLKENNIPVVTGWVVTSEMDTALLPDNDMDRMTKRRYAANDQIAVQTWERRSNELQGSEMHEDTFLPGRELQVMVSRNESGIIECYEPAIMTLEAGKMFIDFDLCPSDLGKETSIMACGLAAKVAASLELKGLITVELIVARNGSMYVNDISIGPNKNGSEKWACGADSKSGLLKRLLLDQPEEGMGMMDICSKLTILEPLAYRKHIVEQALKTIICTNDIHVLYHKDIMKLVKGKPITINEQKIEEQLSKAIMIQHLLRLN